MLNDTISKNHYLEKNSNLKENKNLESEDLNPISANLKQTLNLNEPQILQKLVADELEQNSAQTLGDLAKKFNTSEGEVTFALPQSMVNYCNAERIEELLAILPTWGKVTTIIHNQGSIFEFKVPFPKGKSAHGYYNVMNKEGFHGHLKIDNIAHIAFVSKPFMNMDSHYIGFYTSSGDCMFKVYLGRDKARQLIPEQVTAFHNLKMEMSACQ